ncbi:MAG TPA: flagellar basal body P-ring formation chaperone FlgA [Stellaceae bacterium]|jgi:flagella basal body P-ring formation protein FlgA
MRKLLIAAAAVVLGIAPGAAFADTMLLPSVTVTGDTIHIGDIFRDAGVHADDPVAPAPAPGTRATYNAVWLGSVAREHHLTWQPSSAFDQTSVERASRIVDADAVGQRILSAVAADAPNTDASIQLDNPGLRFVVPTEASDAMAIDGLNLDQRTGRFSVFVTAPANSNTAQRQRVSGRIIYQVTLAVPAHGMSIGDVFGPPDVTEVKLPRERVASDAVTNRQQLVGKAARRILRAGETVRIGDIAEPIVVHKGDLVTIAISTAGMQLTAQGKAVEDGAMGASIRVANTQSNRVIDAVVAGPNQVVIGGSAAVPPRLAAR